MNVVLITNDRCNSIMVFIAKGPPRGNHPRGVSVSMETREQQVRGGTRERDSRVDHNTAMAVRDQARELAKAARADGARAGAGDRRVGPDFDAGALARGPVHAV